MNTNSKTETTTVEWTPPGHGGLKRSAAKKGVALGVSLEEREDKYWNQVDEVVLYRALERAGYRPIRPVYGAGAGPRIIDFRIRYQIGDRRHVLEAGRNGAQGSMQVGLPSRDRIPHKADCIEVDAELMNFAGNRVRMTLPVEFAVLNHPHASGIDDIGLIFSQAQRPEPNADPEHLVDLLEHALFSPWSGKDEETENRQREKFRTTALEMVDNGLLERAEALQRLAERRYGGSSGLNLRAGERIEVHIREDKRGTHIQVETNTAEQASRATAGTAGNEEMRGFARR